MGSFKPRTSAVFAVLFGLVGPGCIRFHTDEEGHLTSVEMRMADKVMARKPSPKPSSRAASDVKQVSATAVTQAPAAEPAAPPAAETPRPPIGSRLAALRPSFPKFTSLVKPSGTPVAEVTALWQNRMASLPDPSRNGAPGAGLAGELFLIGAGPKMPFAEADGKVTFTVYDESKGIEASTPLGSWTFEKEVLSQLVTVDERLGKCYAVFLPWPDYKPTTTRIRLTTRYEPEDGHPLFATTWVTFDDGTSSSERAVHTIQTPVPSPMPASTEVQPPAPTGGVTVPPVSPPAAAPTYPPPIPLAAPRPVPSVSPPRPTELPPLTITLPTRR
jgi:hypothetical protein